MARRARPLKDCIRVGGAAASGFLPTALAVDHPRVHDDDIANPPEFPGTHRRDHDRDSGHRHDARQVIARGVIEPILYPSRLLAASMFISEGVLLGTMEGNPGRMPTRPTSRASPRWPISRLRPAAVSRGLGVKMGAFNQIAVEVAHHQPAARPSSRLKVVQGRPTRSMSRPNRKQGLHNRNKYRPVCFLCDFGTGGSQLVAEESETHSLLEVKHQARHPLRSRSCGKSRWMSESIGDDADRRHRQDRRPRMVPVPSSPRSPPTRTAIATVNGKLAASWSVTLNAQTADAKRMPPHGSTAGPIFIGDIFQVRSRGRTGGAPVAVFGIGSVNGAAKVVFPGHMFVDGNMTGTMDWLEPSMQCT